MEEKQNFKWRQSLGYNKQIPKFLQKIINETQPARAQEYNNDDTEDAVHELQTRGIDRGDERPTVVIESSMRATTSDRELAEYIQQNPDLNSIASKESKWTENNEAEEEVAKQVMVSKKGGRLLFSNSSRADQVATTTSFEGNKKTKNDTAADNITELANAISDASTNVKRKLVKSDSQNADRIDVKSHKKVKKQQKQKCLLSFHDTDDG